MDCSSERETGVVQASSSLMTCGVTCGATCVATGAEAWPGGLQNVMVKNVVNKNRGAEQQDQGWSDR